MKQVAQRRLGWAAHSVGGKRGISVESWWARQSHLRVSGVEPAGWGGGGNAVGQHAGSKVLHDGFGLDMQVAEHGVQLPLPE